MQALTVTDLGVDLPHAGEDASKIRTRHSRENMATLRSFAINQLRDTGRTNIAAGPRTTALRPYERPLVLLGLN